MFPEAMTAQPEHNNACLNAVLAPHVLKISAMESSTKTVDSNSRVKIENRDLFHTPRNYALCHCVSMDYKMSSGIAVVMKSKYPVLKRMPAGKLGTTVAVRQEARVIFNLITKKNHYDKPTLDTMTKAITSMREQCSKFRVDKIAMPLIGCGLDKLEWSDVDKILNKVFKGTNIELLLCKYEKRTEKRKFQPKPVQMDVPLPMLPPQVLDLPQVSEIASEITANTGVHTKMVETHFDVYKMFGFKINTTHIQDKYRSTYYKRKFFDYMETQSRENSSIQIVDNMFFIPSKLITITNFKNIFYHDQNVNFNTKDYLSWYLSKNIVTAQNCLELSALQATLHSLTFLKGSADIVYNASFFFTSFETALQVNLERNNIEVHKDVVENFLEVNKFVIPLDLPLQFEVYERELSMPISDAHLEEFDEKIAYLRVAAKDIRQTPWAFLLGACTLQQRKYIADHLSTEIPDLDIIKSLTLQGFYWFLKPTKPFIKLHTSKVGRIYWTKEGTTMDNDMPLHEALAWLPEKKKLVARCRREKYLGLDMYDAVETVVTDFVEGKSFHQSLLDIIRQTHKIQTGIQLCDLSIKNIVGLNQKFFEEKKELFTSGSDDEYIQCLWDDLHSPNNYTAFNKRVSQDPKFYAFVRYEIGKRSLIDQLMAVSSRYQENAGNVQSIDLQYLVISYIDIIKPMTPRIFDGLVERLGRSFVRGATAELEQSSGVFENIGTAVTGQAMNVITSDPTVQSVQSDISRLAELTTGTPAGNLLSDNREWLTNQVASIISMLNNGMDTVIKTSFNKILGLCGLPAVEITSVSVPRIILAFILYQRLQTSDYIAYIALLTLMFNDSTPILNMIDLVVKIIKHLWEVGKTVIKKATHWECSGCFMCRMFSATSVEPRSDERTSEEIFHSFELNRKRLLAIIVMVEDKEQLELTKLVGEVSILQTYFENPDMDILRNDPEMAKVHFEAKLINAKRQCLSLMNQLTTIIDGDELPETSSTSYQRNLNERKTATYTPPKDFELLLASLENQNDAMEEAVEPPITTETIPTETTPDEERPQGWLCWLKTMWEKHDTKAIAVLGTAIAASIGVKADWKTLYNNASKGVIDVMKNFHWIACGSAAVGRIFQVFYAAFSWAMDQYRKWKNPEYQEESEFLKEVEEWLDKANLCTKGIIEPAYLANPKIGLWYQAIKTQGFAIRAKMSRLISHLSIKVAVEAAWRQVMSVSNVMDALMKFQCGRYEPLHIQIYGAPGIGKTNVQSGLINEIAPHITSNLNAYPINDKLEYLDNYCGQEIATWDDTHLERDDENYIAKILLLSGGSVILPMADLADKGKPIDFKFVLSNTNVPFPTFTNVSENRALWRRRILIKAEVNPGKYENPEEITGTSNKYLQNLLFTVLDPTNESIAPLNRSLTGLVWKDLIKYLTVIAKRHDIVEQKRAQEQGTLNMRRAMEQFKETWTKILAETLPPSSKQMRVMGKLYEDLAIELHTVSTNTSGHAAAAVLINEFGVSVPEPRMDEYDPWFATFASGMSPTRHYNRDMERYVTADIMDGELEADYLARTNVPTSGVRTFSPGEWILEPGHAGWTMLSGHTPVRADLPVGLLMPKLIDVTPTYQTNENIRWYGLREITPDDNFTLADLSGRRITINPNNTTVHVKVNTTPSRISTIVDCMIATDVAEPTGEQLAEWFVIMSNILVQPDMANVRRIVETSEGFAQHYVEMQNRIRGIVNPWRTRIRAIFTSIANWITIDNLVSTFAAILLVFYIVLILMSIRLLLTATNEEPRIYHHEGVKRLATITPRNSSSYHFSQQMTEMSMRHAYRVRVQGLVNRDGRIVETTRAANIVGLRGNLFVTNKHVFQGLLDDVITIKIFDNLNVFAGRPNVNWEQVTIRRSRDIKQIPGRDAVIICLPTFRCTKDGVKHFVTKDDLGANMLEGSNHTCVAFGELNNALYLESIQLRNFNTRHNEKYENAFGIYQNDKIFAYTMDSDAIPSGHSGAVVFHDNTLIQRGFVGIIGASDKTRTIVVPLTQEDLLETMSKFDIVQQVVIGEIEGADPINFDKELYDVTPVVGLYYPKQHGMDKTKLVPTKFHEDIKDKCPYEPGLLSKKDKRFNPELEHYAHIGINKFCYPQVFQDREGIMLAAAELGRYHATLMPNVRFQTLYESVAGSGKLGATPLNLNKGSGLPWSHMTPDKGKKGFINKDEVSGQYNIHNLLRHNVFDILAQCETGTYPPKTYQMFYKDELVKSDKVHKSPKTRTIIMPALDVLVANGILTGDICRNFKNMSITESRIACGFNFESYQFNELVNWLQYHDTMIAFDVKNWDGSCPISWSEAIANYYYELFKTAYAARGEALPARTREVLFTFTIGQAHTTIVHEDVLFVVKHGLKSGERDTLVKNSLGHLIMDYYFYKNIITRTKPQLANINSWLEIVRTVTCGDDVLRGINPVYANVLNPDAYVHEYRTMGFDVTTANKDLNFRFENIYEVSFLQLNVRWDSERSVWAAKTSAKIFWNLLNWQRTTLPEMEQLKVNMYNACRAAWHRGEEEYNNLTEIIPVLCAKYRIPFSVPSYDTIGHWIGVDIDRWSNGVNDDVEVMTTEQQL